MTNEQDDPKRGFTFTYFGRHDRAFNMLEPILMQRNSSKVNAAIIGAGFAIPRPYKRLGLEPKQQSWEYVELATLLNRLGIDWELTIIEENEEVCAEIQEQREVLIDDMTDTVNNSQYSQKVLAGLGEQTMLNNDEFQKLLGGGTPPYPFTQIQTAEIPNSIRDRITVVQGDLTKVLEKQLLKIQS